MTILALFDYIDIPVTIVATSMLQLPTVSRAIGEPMSASFVPSKISKEQNCKFH